MIFNLLLLLIPVSLVLAYLVHSPPIWVFITGVLAILPLAEWIRRATEELAERAGPAIGGLVNVSFGNMPELVLAFFVLAAGHQEVVKGQITGSIIGNSLLGLGMAIIAGSFGRPIQTFNRERAGRLGSLLILTMIALLLPALFDYTERGFFNTADAYGLDEKLSLSVSLVLIFVYIANLVYSLATRQDIYRDAEADDKNTWPVWRSLAVMIGGTLFIALESDLVSGALEPAAASLGMTTFFLGVFVLAIIGNASEYISAVYFARQERLGFSISITVGSTIQIGMLVAPLLVVGSFLLGKPMNLVFANPLELIAIAAVAFVVNAIAHDGETNWFEGLMLLAVYVLLALAFFFVTP